MSEKNKPFYKKWWGIAIIAFVVIAGVYGIIEEEMSEDDPPEATEDDDNEENNTNNENENNENDNSDDKNNEEESREKRIEVNEEIKIGNVNIEIQTIKLEDDSVTIPIRWNHWASNDKVHLTALVYPVVTQDGEELKQIDGKDNLLKQAKKGVDSLAEVKYELIDRSPIEVKFKTTSDDPEEETITINIE